MTDGVLNNGPVTIPITTSGYVESLVGSNLIGNPYQSYLDFEAFAANPNNAAAGINAYYVLDADKKGYIAYVQGGSTPTGGDVTPTENSNSTDGNYNVSHQHFGQSHSGSGIVDYSAPQYLHPHQGFFVKVDAPTTVTFTNVMRRDDVKSQFRGGNHYPMVNLICSDTAGCNEFATVEVGRPDNGGGKKIKGLHTGDASLWVHYDEEDWHVAFTPLGTKAVPVHFKAYADGVYTMRWQPANTSFNYIHLIDNLTGADIDCLAEEQYLFEGHTGDYKSRFMLLFDFVGNEAPEEPEDPEAPEPVEGLTTFAFQMGDQLIVNGEGTLQMFDIQGRCLLEKGTVGAQSAVSLPRVANGVYVLRLINGTDLKVQKIVINKWK